MLNAGLWSSLTPTGAGEEVEEKKDDAAILAATVKNGLFLKSRSCAELLLIRPSGLIWRHISLFIDLLHSLAQATGADISQPPRNRCLSRFSRQKKQQHCGIKVTVSVAVEAVISSHKFNPTELLPSNVSHSGIKPEFNCNRQEGVTWSGSRVTHVSTPDHPSWFPRTNQLPFCCDETRKQPQQLAALKNRRRRKQDATFSPVCC